MPNKYPLSEGLGGLFLVAGTFVANTSFPGYEIVAVIPNATFTGNIQNAKTGNAYNHTVTGATAGGDVTLTQPVYGHFLSVKVTSGQVTVYLALKQD